MSTLTLSTLVSWCSDFMAQAQPLPSISLAKVSFIVLTIVFLLLQFSLWSGAGSLLTVWKLKADIEAQTQKNLNVEARNERLRAEVLSLKEGLDAVEERARLELGMIRDDETFFLIIDPAQRAVVR